MRLKYLFVSVTMALCVATPTYADSLGSAVGGTAANQSSLGGCKYNSSAPSLTTGQQVAVQCDASGNIKVVTSAPSGGQSVTQNPVTAVPSAQNGLSIATATAPTIPATATYILAQAQGTNNTSGVCLFWEDDGTNPTGSAGQGMGSLGSIWRKVTSDGIKFIQATGATCTVSLSYYKDSP